MDAKNRQGDHELRHQEVGSHVIVRNDEQRQFLEEMLTAANQRNVNSSLIVIGIFAVALGIIADHRLCAGYTRRTGARSASWPQTSLERANTLMYERKLQLKTLGAPMRD